MNFELTEEHKMIRDAARDFAQTELLPGVIERDESQTFPAEQIKKLGLCIALQVPRTLRAWANEEKEKRIFVRSATSTNSLEKKQR